MKNQVKKAVKKQKSVWTPAERAAWRLPEKVTVSQWADANRVLPSDTAEPGPYRTSRTPYMREPMNAFCDSEIELIDIMSGAQIGKSSAIQNMVGYAIDQDPGPAMYVVPRDDDIVYASQKVFKPMIESSEALKNHTTGSPRDLQTEFFSFDRMTLYFASAGSPAEMAQKAIKYLFFDEPDKYPPFAGKEANPISLGVKRTTTFWDRKIVKVCTPTTKDGYINSSYVKSNMQEYYIPCPKCGEYQIWKFIQLRVPPKMHDPDEIRKKKDVWYECETCGYKIREEIKEQLVAAGKWVPAGQTIDANGNISGTPKRSKRHSGFHITSLVSPWKDWAEIMAEWFEANTEEEMAKGALLDFNNSVLGKPFEETGKKLKAKEVKKLLGSFSKGTVPGDCLLLVAGADYHKSRARGIVRIDYEVRGFGYGMKNWVIKTGSISSFEKLDEEVLLEPFPWADGTDNETKPWLAVTLMFIDSGYEPDDVYDYCRQRPRLTIPTKGMPGPLLRPIAASELETATEKRLSAHKRARYRGMQLLTIDTYYFKNQVTSWAEARVDENGKVIAGPLTQFYNEIPGYYFTEFTNEHLVKVHSSRGVAKWLWKPVTTGAPTHSLDTAVLCAAAGYYKGIHYLRRPGEKKKQAAVAAVMQQRLSSRRRGPRRPAGDAFLDDMPEL
ncbi:MAG: hypothetical protein DRP62_05280 [Planctomycetota bacterium]|nr:MAG: hypothetical protein DRP62_05280 [Planctomycetota bacterium]